MTIAQSDLRMRNQHVRDSGYLSAEEMATVRLSDRRASWLPPRCYNDPDFYAAEVEHVFRKTWLSIGWARQIPNPGDYFTIDVLNEPLVVVRDRQNAIRVLSRVCRHRGMLVVAGSGNAQSFECPYHTWTYALDGKLIGAPEMQRAEAFEKSNCRLPEFRSELWEGWIFVNFDPDAEQLGPQLAPLQRQITSYRLAEMRALGPLDYESTWNWKIMVENASESYHHLGAHRDVVEELLPARLTVIEDNKGPYTLVRNPTKDGAPVPLIFAPIEGLTDAQRSELFLCNAYPCHLFFGGPDHMAWLQMIPERVDYHRVRWHFFLPPTAFDEPDFEQKAKELGQFYDLLHKQDMEICRGVQRGRLSTMARAGRLSHLEKSVWQFHQWLLDRFDGAGP